jgi:excisionase family DNA binding protein
MTQFNYSQFYNIKEAAKELRVSEPTVRKYIKEGRLESIKLGRQRYISYFQMRRFLLGTDADRKDG